MRFAVLVPVILLTACASAPKAPPTAAPAPTSAPASAAAPTPTSSTGAAFVGAPGKAADAAASEKGEFDTINAANIAEAQKAGYKVVNQDGETLLCRKTKESGTRVRYLTTCLTAARWKEQADAGREAVHQPQLIPFPQGGR
jgi:hypothetical protein